MATNRPIGVDAFCLLYLVVCGRGFMIVRLTIEGRRSWHVKKVVMG